jgi:hypothetical protein
MRDPRSIARKEGGRGFVYGLRMLLLRVVASKSAMLILSLFVIVAAAESLIQQFSQIYSFFSNGTFNVDIELEEDIAIILVCLGVVLEERGMFTMKFYDGNISPLDEMLNTYACEAGTYCLLFGLVMEVLDQLYNSIVLLGEWSAFLAALVIFLFHGASIYILLEFSRKVLAASSRLAE